MVAFCWGIHAFLKLSDSSLHTKKQAMSVEYFIRITCLTWNFSNKCWQHTLWQLDKYMHWHFSESCEELMYFWNFVFPHCCTSEVKWPSNQNCLPERVQQHDIGLKCTHQSGWDPRAINCHHAFACPTAAFVLHAPGGSRLACRLGNSFVPSRVFPLWIWRSQGRWGGECVVEKRAGLCSGDIFFQVNLPVLYDSGEPDSIEVVGWHKLS